MRPSSLITRRVLQTLIAERPYRAPECLRRKSILQSQCSPANIQPFVIQKRHFFEINLKPPAKQFEGAKYTNKNIELALVKLVNLVRGKRKQTRVPSDDELLDAFKFLFAARAQATKPMTRNETFLAAETYDYLNRRNAILNKDGSTALSLRDFQNILLALAATGAHDKFRSDSRALATSVFETLQKQESIMHEAKSQKDHPLEFLEGQLFDAYVTVLARTGSSMDALNLLRNSGQAPSAEFRSLWSSALQGLVNEGRIQDFGKTFKEFRDRFNGLTPDMQQELVTFLARRNDVSGAMKMFETPLQSGSVLTTQSLAEVLKMCIRLEKFDLGAPVAEQLRSRTDTGDIAGTLSLWFAIQNPNVDAVKEYMIELADAGTTDAITMPTFNRLIQWAFSKDKVNLANEYIEVMKSFGLRPDGETYTYYLDFEIRRGDLNAAARIYDLLAVEDFPEPRADIPVLNRYLAAIAFSPNPDYQLLMRVVDKLLESRADLDADAIAGLCWVFLQKEELHEAAELLRYRADFYPRTDRARIGAVFQQFILDLNVKDQRAFEAYDLFRQAFPETSVEDRLPLMQSFFDRNRPDLGCLVFGHMRQREDLPARPTAEAYAQCYSGIAQCKDVDGLQMVYNMLKMDREVEFNTRIRNALIQAYTACHLPFLAIIDHFWKILDSREGPTLSSFALALRASEIWVPQGSQEARRIIALMQRWNLVITREIYHCFIGALAGQSEFENVVELIEEMEKDIGEKPDALTIGTFYNAIPWQYRKDEVEAWAKQAYPELWEDLVSYGDVVDEEWEVRYFKIDRSIDMDDELLFGEGEYNPELSRGISMGLAEPKA